MLHRYGTVDYIFSLDFVEGCELIIKAKQEEMKERYHAEYCAALPFMLFAQKEVKSFDEICNIVTGKNIDRRSEEEILAEAREIENQLKGGRR